MGDYNRNCPSSAVELDQSRERSRIAGSRSPRSSAFISHFGGLAKGRVSLFEGSMCCLVSLFHMLQQPHPPWSKQRETGLNRNWVISSEYQSVAPSHPTVGNTVSEQECVCV